MRGAMPASEENKTLFRYLKIVFGGSPRMTRYLDDAEESHIDVLIASDVPHKNVTTYSTIGLSDASTGLMVEGVPLGIEIVLSAHSNFEFSANILSTCAFNIINSEMVCKPESIFRDVVAMYQPNLEMKHIFFVDPFLWPLRSHKFPSKIAAWLFAVPISEKEFEFVEKNGGGALAKAFEKHQIDVFNLHRKSIF
jgi:hypothetical protein